MANQYQHDFADIVDIDTKYCYEKYKCAMS